MTKLFDYIELINTQNKKIDNAKTISKLANISLSEVLEFLDIYQSNLN